MRFQKGDSPVLSTKHSCRHIHISWRTTEVLLAAAVHGGIEYMYILNSLEINLWP